MIKISRCGRVQGSKGNWMEVARHSVLYGVGVLCAVVGSWISQEFGTSCGAAPLYSAVEASQVFSPLCKKVLLLCGVVLELPLHLRA